MDALQALLSANLEIEQDVYIKRLGVNFRIKAISTKELEKAREQCTKGTRKDPVIDTDRLNAVLAVKFCASPDFGDKALLAKYDAANAVECVGKALLPGELTKIIAAGMELSGFGDDEEDVKN